jgi:hypothetical protein
MGGMVAWARSRIAAWAVRFDPRRAAAGALCLSVLAGAGQFALWAADRSYVFTELSRRVGTLIGDGVPVQGDAAMALSLDNRTRPRFVGERIGEEQAVLRGDGVDYLLVFPDARLDGRMQALMAAHADAAVVASFAIPPRLALEYHRRVVLLKKRGKSLPGG